MHFQVSWDISSIQYLSPWVSLDHPSACDKIRTKWETGFIATFQKASSLWPAPKYHLAHSLTRSFKITELFSSRKTQLLALIIGESDGAMSVLCLSSPNWQFQAASFPPDFREEAPKPCKQLRIVYLLFLNKSNGNWSAFLGMRSGCQMVWLSDRILWRTPSVSRDRSNCE